MKKAHFVGILSLSILSLFTLFPKQAQAIPINVGIIFGVDATSRNECDGGCRRHRHRSQERVKVIYVENQNQTNDNYNNYCYAVDQYGSRIQMNCNSINSNGNNRNNNSQNYDPRDRNYPTQVNNNRNRDPNCAPNDWCDRR